MTRPSSAVSLEDIERVLSAAYWSGTRLEAEGDELPTIRDAVARIRAALGGEDA